MGAAVRPLPVFCLLALTAGALSALVLDSNMFDSRNHLKDEALNMTVAEEVGFAAGGQAMVTDTYSFDMPELVAGQDVLLTPMEAGANGSVIFYVGSYGHPGGFYNDSITMTEIWLNGKRLRHAGGERNAPEGWVKMLYVDGSDNFDAYAQPGSLALGGRNTLSVKYRLNRKGANPPYYNAIGLDAGGFSPVFNADARLEKIWGENAVLEFNVTNAGIPTRASKLVLEIRADAPFEVSTGENAANLQFAIQKQPPALEKGKLLYSAKATAEKPDLPSKENLFDFSLNFSDRRKSGEGKAGNITIMPAFSYGDSSMRQLNPMSLGLDRPKLRILYVPVNWGGNQSAFEREAQRQHDFLVYSLPSLANCSWRIEKCTLDGGPRIDGIFNKSASEVLDAIERWTDNKAREGSYDFLVGIGMRDSFSGNTAGYTVKNRKTNLVVFVLAGYPITTAHEIGHHFGLSDEYCDCPGLCNTEPNPLKKEYGCDPNGGCCWQDFDLLGWEPLGGNCSLGGYEKHGCKKCCTGNANPKGGISIMSWVDAKGPRYHDNMSLEHLAKNKTLECD